MNNNNNNNNNEDGNNARQPRLGACGASLSSPGKLVLHYEVHPASSFCCLHAPMLFTRLQCQMVFHSRVRWYLMVCCGEVAAP